MGNNDVFWHINQDRAFLLLNGNIVVDMCATPRMAICIISIGSTPVPVISPATIHIAWEADFLAIYIEDPGLFNLDGLEITDNPAVANLLQDESAFESLRFNAIPGPVCFYYTTRDSNGSLPQGCHAERRIIQYVSSSGVFWHVNHLNRNLFVIQSGTQIGNICPNTAPCTRQIP